MMLALPKPVRRSMILPPVPLYGCMARLQIPCDMTEQEARKLANFLIAYAAVTSHCPSHPRSQPDSIGD